MYLLVIGPFVVQALCILFDEYYFHVKRGLPLWERIGHPLDTLSVIACLIFVLSVPYSALALKWYVALCLFSCLMITKDEWVHKHHCPATEQWLHALLFINHPIVLFVVGLMWWVIHGKIIPPWMAHWLHDPEAKVLQIMLIGQLVFTILFFLYQIIYWNFICKEKKISQ